MAEPTQPEQPKAPEVEVKPTEETISKQSYDVVAGKYRDNKAKLEELQGKYDSLEQRATEFETKEAKLTEAIKQQAIALELTKAGTIDLDIASKVIDMGTIEFDEQSLSVRTETIATQVDTLKETKPFLFQKAVEPKQPAGFDGAEANTGRPRTYTQVELKDSEFVKRNLEDIKLAIKEGRIK
jgi:hypothetical protein